MTLAPAWQPAASATTTDPLVVVHHPRRLLGEAVTAALAASLPAGACLPPVTDPDELRQVAAARPVTHAVVSGGDPHLGSGIRVLSLRKDTTVERLAGAILPAARCPEPLVVSGTDLPGGELTPQQVRVVALLSLGCGVPETARCLGISPRAVARTKVAAYARLGVQNAPQAVAVALERGILIRGPRA